MSNPKIAVGILGAGAMGSEHAAVYGEIDGVEVSGVFSRMRDRAAVLAQSSHARPFIDPYALINDTSIDAIDVCVPSAEHAPFVLAALRAGKHVFCETPFTLRLQDGDAMIAAARKSGRVLLVGLLIRSIADYVHVKRAAESGEHGRLLSITTYRLGSYLRAGAADHKEHYTDPSTELMTFDFDFVNWAMGAPIRVSAKAVNTERGTPGEISALLSFADGRIATVLASGIMPKSFPFSVGFRAVLERGAFDLSTVFGAGPPKSTLLFYPEEGNPETVAVEERNPFEVELQYFAACIRGEADGSILDAAHAMDALRLSVATQQSLRAGQPINVDDIPRR